jgi:hypothetical protein
MQPGHIDFDNDFYKRVGRMWLFLPDSIKGWLLLGQVLLEELLIWLTNPCECLLRRRFGTRALSLFVVVQIVTAALTIITLSFYRICSLGLVVFSVAAAVAAVCRYREARRFELSGQERHSYTTGEPLPFWQRTRCVFRRLRRKKPEEWLTDWMIIRFYEPALCLVIGIPAFFFIGLDLGSYLVACSVAILLKSHIEYQRAITLWRDRKDAQIVAKVMAEPTTPGPDPSEKEPSFLVSVVPPEPTRAMPPASTSGWGPDPMHLPPEEPAVAKVECPSCNARIRVKQKYRGRRSPCPSCNVEFIIPAA